MIFRIALWAIGVLLTLGSRFSRRLRDQIARELSLCIATQDGVARTFYFAERRASSRSGGSDSADCIVTFTSAHDGLRILLATNCIERIVEGLAREEITLSGDATIVLWFYEMTMGLLPWHRPKITAAPDAYMRPSTNGLASTRITREPAVVSLDPQWAGALSQREKLHMWRVGNGAPVPGKPKNFKHVIDIESLDAENGR